MRWWSLLLCVPCFLSCQKVKEVIAKRSSSGKQDPAAQEAKAQAQAAGAIDPELEAQIDRTPEGVRFRKDLPFPTRLTVKETMTLHPKGMRITRSSAIGKEAGLVEGTDEKVRLWQRDGDRLTLTIEKDSFTPAKKKEEKAPAVPASDSKPPEGMTGQSATFRLAGGKWKAEKSPGGDFKRVLWTEGIEPAIGGMAVDAGALPSGFWFGKPRFKEGTPAPLTGDGLKLLFREAATGKIDLTFEAVEGVDGHPCGRFAIRGECTQQGLVSAEGNRSNTEISITSGKVWLSLLHPVVMRQELDAVLTTTVGSGGAATRMQGPVCVSSRLEWKPGK